jgi:hypothetical protein
MIHYSFADKHSNCVLILSAENDEEAIELLKEKVKNPEFWRKEILERD